MFFPIILQWSAPSSPVGTTHAVNDAETLVKPKRSFNQEIGQDVTSLFFSPPSSFTLPRPNVFHQFCLLFHLPHISDMNAHRQTDSPTTYLSALCWVIISTWLCAITNDITAPILRNVLRAAARLEIFKLVPFAFETFLSGKSFWEPMSLNTSTTNLYIAVAVISSASILVSLYLSAGSIVASPQTKKSYINLSEAIVEVKLDHLASMLLESDSESVSSYVDDFLDGEGSLMMEPSNLSKIKRSKAIIKVHHVHIDQVKVDDIDAVKGRLQGRFPGICFSKLFLRPGCVIVDLDMMQSEEGNGNETPFPQTPDLLASLDEEGLFGSGDHHGQPISVQIDGETSIYAFNKDHHLWSILDHHDAPQGCPPPLASAQHLCLSLPQEGPGKIYLQLRTDTIPEGLEAVHCGKALQVSKGSSGPYPTNGRGGNIEIDLVKSTPGLMTLNIWSKGQPSRILASQKVLLLPPGFSAAAEEVSEVVVDAYSTPDREKREGVSSLLEDIAFLIENKNSGANIPNSLYKEVAASLIAWVQSANCPHLEQLIHGLSEPQRVEPSPSEMSMNNSSSTMEEDAASLSLPQILHLWPTLMLPWALTLSSYCIVRMISLIGDPQGSSRILTAVLFFWPYLMVVASYCAVWLGQGPLGNLMFQGTSLRSHLHSHLSLSSTMGLGKLLGARRLRSLVWLLGNNIGLVLQLNRSGVILLTSVGVLTSYAPSLSLGVSIIVSMCSMVEPYDLRVAALVTTLFQAPAWGGLFFSTGTGCISSMLYAAGLGLLSMAGRTLISHFHQISYRAGTSGRCVKSKND